MPFYRFALWGDFRRIYEKMNKYATLPRNMVKMTPYSVGLPLFRLSGAALPDRQRFTVSDPFFPSFSLVLRLCVEISLLSAQSKKSVVAFFGKSVVGICCRKKRLPH